MAKISTVKTLRVTVSHESAICYDETFKYLEIFFFWNRIFLGLNYSPLAETSLTVINEML